MQNSAFSELLLQIQDRIQEKVTAIRQVDEEKGQLESYDEKTGRPMVSFPCLLVDFNVLAITDQGDGIQDVQLDVVLRLGFPPFSSAASWMPQDVKEKGLKYFDIEYFVYLALHTWTPEGFTTFLNRPSRTEKREDTLRVRELHYETEYRETSLQPQRTRINKPALEVETQEVAQPGTS